MNSIIDAIIGFIVGRHLRRSCDNCKTKQTIVADNDGDVQNRGSQANSEYGTANSTDNQTSENGSPPSGYDSNERREKSIQIVGTDERLTYSLEEIPRELGPGSNAYDFFMPTFQAQFPTMKIVERGSFDGDQAVALAEWLAQNEIGRLPPRGVTIDPPFNLDVGYYISNYPNVETEDGKTSIVVDSSKFWSK